MGQCVQGVPDNGHRSIGCTRFRPSLLSKPGHSGTRDPGSPVDEYPGTSAAGYAGTRYQGTRQRGFGYPATQDPGTWILVLGTRQSGNPRTGARDNRVLALPTTRLPWLPVTRDRGIQTPFNSGSDTLAPECWVARSLSTRVPRLPGAWHWGIRGPLNPGAGKRQPGTRKPGLPRTGTPCLVAGYPNYLNPA